VVGGNAAFYPRLSILAKKYLAIPVSYVPSEHIKKKNYLTRFDEI
jgi:hypothetical protein